MNSHQDDYLLETSSKSCLQASHFALTKFLFAYFKQPKHIFLLKIEPSLTLESPLRFSFEASSRFQGLLQDNGARSKLPGKSSDKSVNTIGKSKLRYSFRRSFYYIRFMRTNHILNLHLLLRLCA